MRDSFSLELVEVATRLLAGIQLEKTAKLLESESQTSRLKQADEFNIDSLAIALGNIEKMKNFANIEIL